MSLLDEIKSKAAARNKTIVLCEGEDERVVRAAAQITKEGIAKIVLIGNAAECKSCTRRRFNGSNPYRPAHFG